MRVFPVMFVVFAFARPPALVVYFVVSNLSGSASRRYITRTMYRGEDSLVRRPHRRCSELRKQKGGGASRDHRPS